jgi:3,4-dihydroxy 2-butanone 4-phosphate synthase/GTP cyclohydrolase II
MEEINALLSKATDHRRKGGRPWVTLSYAQSLDGCIAAHPGQTLALSGPQSLVLTHRLRAAHDAILVGIGTVLADDPRLTVRLVEGKDPQPVIVDSQLRLPMDANLLGGHSSPPWIATCDEADPDRQRSLETANARVLRIPADPDGGVYLVALLECLGTLGINSLMVEGGARIITSFLREQLVDLLILTVSPLLVGGVHAVDSLRTTDLVGFPRLSTPHYEWLGGDLILWGELSWGQV